MSKNQTETKMIKMFYEKEKDINWPYNFIEKIKEIII